MQCRAETVVPVAAEQARGGESENKVTEGKADPVKESEGKVTEGQADPVNPLPAAEHVVGGGESKNKLGNSATISSPSTPAPVGALDTDVVPGVCVCVCVCVWGGARERGMDLV